MNAMKQISTFSFSQPNPSTEHLRQCCLIVDGNAHRQDLHNNYVDFEHSDVICESLLPEIRVVAMMIAASRHDFSQRSPAIFADEADWFAARIIALKVREFHLDVKLCEMLQIANARAAAFAARHDLSFQAAKMRPSLHAKRPNNMLLLSCDVGGEVCQNIYQNTQALRQVMFKFM